MKNTILFLFVALGLLSCTDMPVEPLESSADTPMTFKVNVAETKAAITDWVDGDKIFVFFRNLGAKYLVLTYNGSTWTGESAGGTLTTGDFSSLSEMHLNALHFPKAAGVTVRYDGNQEKFFFTSDDKPYYNYFLCYDGDYTIDGTTLTATLSMNKWSGMVLFHIAGAEAKKAHYGLKSDIFTPVAITSISKAGHPEWSSLAGDLLAYGIPDADGVVFAGSLYEEYFSGGAHNCTFHLKGAVKGYTLNKDMTLSAGKMYNLPDPTAAESPWTPLPDSNFYVDLGTAGKWARCNLGASNPEDFGDYFAWGEPSGYFAGKTYFSYENYAWGTSLFSDFTKYVWESQYGTVDNLNTLEYRDDAAYQASGGKFRMPTIGELEALFNLQKEWVSNYNNSGVSGCKITGNDRSIFLPAAGYRQYELLVKRWDEGRYWSSSLKTDQDASTYMAWSGGVELQSLIPNTVRAGRYPINRFMGLSIRPIYAQ